MAGLRLVTNSITTQVRLGVVQTTLISPTTQQHPAYDTQTAHHPHHTTFRRGRQTLVAPGHHTSAVPPIVALDHSRDLLYTYCDLSAKHSNSPIHPKAGKLSTPPRALSCGGPCGCVRGPPLLCAGRAGLGRHDGAGGAAGLR